ncbi:MAG: formate--tetrahydrofolate ligase [Christensenellales bacterium]
MIQYSDIEIAKNTKLKPILEIAQKLGIDEKYIDHYGNYKAKIDPCILETLSGHKDGKLILVTAVNPTPAGEGKTTTTIGLADGLCRLGKKAAATLREPSMGPVFGMKGGATGGGFAQAVPMEDINLHFTGDMHAVTSANNLLSALIDNHIYYGNELGIDPKHILWRRCMDINDRQMREIVLGLGSKSNGCVRQDGYDITAASEIMAILCLACNMEDLKERLGNIVIGYTFGGQPVTANSLKAVGAMAALLKDALKPNIVQSLEQTPVLIHGGPFANIAHGCNSLMAAKIALKLGDYVVSEAGFGADLGAEKFFDIKCRIGNLKPDAVVVVASIKALKYHGGAEKDALYQENLTALEKGIPNLFQHVENINDVFRLPLIVAINHFPTDTDAEIRLVKDLCQAEGIKAIVSPVWEKGGEGAMELAAAVIEACDSPNRFSYCYDTSMPVYEKIETIAKRIYRADGIALESQANNDLQALEKNGYGNLPVCIAKTQFSFSDNPSLRCAPRGFRLTVKSLKVSAGAGFIVAITGNILTMPGLPKVPSAEKIDVDKHGNITGLF